jgi:hypothetical protein
MRKTRPFVAVALLATALAAAAILAGCGTNTADSTDTTQGRPKSVTAYEAGQFTKPAADKWQASNWMVQTRSADPDGVSKDGKAQIWEVYYFAPAPEQGNQMFVIYNRGNVWPNAPSDNKGADKGLDIYRKNKPPDFRVDSGEAYQVARQNGGGDFMDAHPDARANMQLRCKADYDAIAEKTPSAKYKWIWDVSFREPKVGAEELHVLIDGMTGDFISKETKSTTQ